jgi:hypothetical protein
VVVERMGPREAVVGAAPVDLPQVVRHVAAIENQHAPLAQESQSGPEPKVEVEGLTGVDRS